MYSQRPGTLLLADTDLDVRARWQQELTAQGHQVTVCSTVAEAQAYIDKEPFDVVLCARRMPDADGRQFCEHLKTQTETASISFGLICDADDPIAQSWPPDMKSLSQPDSILARDLPPISLAWRLRNLLRVHRYLCETQGAIGVLMAVGEGIEEQDRRASGHCRRLSVMAIELGVVANCDEYDLVALERAAYLHDIGKSRISGLLLDRPQPLSPRELEIVKDHPVLGENLCRPVAALAPVLPIIRHHHERNNGTGYPDGLHAESIPFLAQIFAIVDVYDALRMWRPFRPAMDAGQALVTLRQEVGQGLLNRHLLEAFEAAVLPGLDDRLDAVHALWREG